MIPKYIFPMALFFLLIWQGHAVAQCRIETEHRSYTISENESAPPPVVKFFVVGSAECQKMVRENSVMIQAYRLSKWEKPYGPIETHPAETNCGNECAAYTFKLARALFSTGKFRLVVKGEDEQIIVTSKTFLVKK